MAYVKVPPPPPPPALEQQPPSEDVKLKIGQALEALRRRGAIVTQCPRCNQNAWRADLVSYFVGPVPPSPSFSLPPAQVPSLTLTCNVCGYTIIHNLLVLGVTL
jgi:hypothetical protein